MSNLSIDQISTAGAAVSFRCLLSDGATPPQTLTRESTPGRTIPDNESAGISDTIDIAEALIISGAKVGVDITHTYRGDLRVTLTTPWGAEIVLHPKNQGGNAADLRLTYDETLLPALATLRGQSTQGAWRLTVQDLASADVGRLNKWSLAFSSAAMVTQPVVLAESPGTLIPDNNPAGITRTLAVVDAGKVASVEVVLDIGHSYIGDLRVSLRSPAGTEVLLHDRTGASADNLVKTFTAVTTPALGTLGGQGVAGNWTLNVSDGEAQDVGKLNRWGVTIRRI